MGMKLPDHKVVLDFFGPWGWRLAHKARLIVWRITRPQRFGVFAVVFNHAGEVLLVENSYAKGWRLPGGGVEWGESVEESMARELREEVQLEAKRMKLVNIHHMLWNGASNQIIVFRVDEFSGEARADGNEILRVMWASPDRLPPETEPNCARQIALAAAIA